MTEGYLTAVCEANVCYGVVLRVITVPHSRHGCFSPVRTQRSDKKQTALSAVVVWASVAVCDFLTPWS
jgi:hypothetical protein